MKYIYQKCIKSSIIALLLLANCERVFVDPEPVYETAIRYYVNAWQELPAYLVLSVEGENPSENLLNRLNDLETELIHKDAGKLIRNSGESGRMTDLSVRILKRTGLKSVKVRISSQTDLNGYVDAHGIDYYLQKKKGEWVIVNKGVEWMT